MNRILTSFLLIISMSIHANSQNLSTEFKVVGKEDIEYKSFPGDPSASAVVLFDKGNSRFERQENSFDLMFERTTRIKILKEGGLKWAEIEIPFYQEGDIYEEIEQLEAYAYNLENDKINKVALDVKDSHIEKINNRWNLKKFAIPNVKVGSIIEYKYTIRSQYLFNLRDWDFQWKIPVVYSQYEARMIPFYNYQWLLQGANKFDSQTSVVDGGFEKQFGSTKYHDYVHTFVMKNIPAFKDEEFITSSEDHIIKINFQLHKVIRTDGSEMKILTSWPEVVDELIKHDDFGKFAKKCERSADKLIDLTKIQSKTEEERFDTILTLVKNNFRWDGFTSKYANKSIKNLLTEKTGTNADLNLLTIGLLNAAGIKAWPVILSTRNNGKVRMTCPFINAFNYVAILAEVNNKKVLSDATDPSLQNKLLPTKCLNDKGLIIMKDKTDWVNLECFIPSNLQTAFKTTIVDKNQKTEVVMSAQNYLAQKLRNKYGDKEEEIIKEMEKKGYAVADSSVHIKKQESIKSPFVVKFQMEQTVEQVNGKLYFLPFMKEVISDNPFKQTERNYEIDMVYPERRTFISFVNIPEGYKVDFLPKNVSFDNELFQLDYTAEKSETGITISFSYYQKKSVYPAADYLRLKFYFNEVLNKANERIVFAKK